MSDPSSVKKCIPALLIGMEEDDESLPDKNLLNVLGRPICEYPMLAAKHSMHVDRLYVSTDSQSIIELAKEYDSHHIKRPLELSKPGVGAESVFAHGYKFIREDLEQQGFEIDLIVLLMCNAATLTAELIDTGVELLRANPEADSAITVSEYNMWSPIRARRLNIKGYLDSYIPLDQLEGIDEVNCDRDSQGDVYFHDIGVSVVRAHCLEKIENGKKPMRWMGRHVLPIINWGGLDMDFPWQIGMVEFWLREHGVKYKGMRNAKNLQKTS
ncbi:cytidylyltransferase [Verrucomicrobia bacterium]|nr:cytidylyltransferase [Verrucomicrobiota bacterium]